MEGKVRGNACEYAVPRGVGCDTADNQGRRAFEPGKRRFQHALGVRRECAAAGH